MPEKVISVWRIRATWLLLGAAGITATLGARYGVSLLARRHYSSYFVHSLAEVLRASLIYTCAFGDPPRQMSDLVRSGVINIQGRVMYVAGAPAGYWEYAQDIQLCMPPRRDDLIEKDGELIDKVTGGTYVMAIRLDETIGRDCLVRSSVMCWRIWGEINQGVPPEWLKSDLESFRRAVREDQ